MPRNNNQSRLSQCEKSTQREREKKRKTFLNGAWEFRAEILSIQSQIEIAGNHSSTRGERKSKFLNQNGETHACP